MCAVMLNFEGIMSIFNQKNQNRIKTNLRKTFYPQISQIEADFRT